MVSGERYQDPCIRQRLAFGVGSAMVWGGISARGRTSLAIISGNLNAHRYLEEVVRSHVLTPGSCFSFCVVSERIQASRSFADRPLAVLTVLAETDPVTRSGKNKHGGDI